MFMLGFEGSASVSLPDVGVGGREVGVSTVGWAAAAGPEHVQPLPAGWTRTGEQSPRFGGRCVRP